MLCCNYFVFGVVLQKYREKGVFHFTVDVPDKTASLSLSASYQDDMGSMASASAQAIAYYSPQVSIYIYTKRGHDSGY